MKNCFLEGFFMNVSRQFHKNTYATLGKRKIVQIHPSSFSSNKNHEFICYFELVLTQEEYMRQVIAVDKDLILKHASSFYSVEEIEKLIKKGNIREVLGYEKKKRTKAKRSKQL